MSEGELEDNCYKCLNKREIPGNSHIQCVKPDPDMTGNQLGIERGWFMYPQIFDPVWKTKLCNNFEPKEKREENNGN